MKLNGISLSQLASFTLLFLLGTGFTVSSWAGEMKLEAKLIWGSNDKTSPDPKHKRVEGKLEEKLKKTPFKWQYYYEVHTVSFTVAVNETHSEKLSKDCEIKVRNLDKETVSVELYGKGELVSKHTQALPKKECYVTGGNAANLTAWFVVLHQAE